MARRGNGIGRGCVVEIKLVLWLPRDVVSVPVSRQVLDSCLQTLGVMPDIRADIALALTEACANVIQHAGPGEEYEVQVSARNQRCVIEVVNAGGSKDGAPAPDGSIASIFQHSRGQGRERPAGSALTEDPVSAIAEHGRGLKIIDAVADNLVLTSTEPTGTTVHFEKKLEWLPEAAGQRLFDGDRE